MMNVALYTFELIYVLSYHVVLCYVLGFFVKINIYCMLCFVIILLIILHRTQHNMLCCVLCVVWSKQSCQTENHIQRGSC